MYSKTSHDKRDKFIYFFVCQKDICNSLLFHCANHPFNEAQMQKENKDGSLSNIHELGKNKQ
jgi:hypothetical protein